MRDDAFRDKVAVVVVGPGAAAEKAALLAGVGDKDQWAVVAADDPAMLRLPAVAARRCLLKFRFPLPGGAALSKEDLAAKAQELLAEADYPSREADEWEMATAHVGDDFIVGFTFRWNDPVRWDHCQPLVKGLHRAVSALA